VSDWRPINPSPLWKRRLPEFLHGPVIIGMRVCLLAGIGLTGMCLYYFLNAMRYDMEEVARLPQGIVFLDANGREISTPSTGGRKLVERREIPDFLVKSLIAREDSRFFEHHGVDFRGLARATVRNIKDRDFTQGASTLSMQLARNTYGNRDKSLHRKFLEIAITLRLELRYSKDEILTHYLNRIYFGSGANGIEQAAHTYFDKTTANLSEAECALLAGIIRGPHLFSPLRNPEAAIEQRYQTLDRMVVMGFISKSHRNELAAEPLRLTDDIIRLNQTSYALQAVQRELDSILDESDIQHGGLNVHTTLDTAWQQRLERELNHAVQALEQESGWTKPIPKNHITGLEPTYVQYAAVTTETKSGAILALIGGRDFSHSRFDRTRSSRDLGSAFEPFVAAAAAERGKLVLAGKPVQTGRQIGPREVMRIAKRCGLTGPYQETEDLFRGAVAATPLEMSVGIATLGNQGKRPKPFLIREIRNAKGDIIYTAKSDLTAALSPSAALDGLSVFSRENNTRTFTGATASERDAWTLRLGPSGSTAIWIGFDQPATIATEKRLNSLLEEFVKRLGNK